MSLGYDIGGMLLSSLGGALVPLSAMPHWMRHVAPASPGYWAVSALHAALDGDGAGTVRASAVLIGFAAGLCPGGRAASGPRRGPLGPDVSRTSSVSRHVSRRVIRRAAASRAAAAQPMRTPADRPGGSSPGRGCKVTS